MKNNDSNFYYICWWDNTPEHNQFRRVFTCTGDNFLTQVMGKQKKGDTLLDLAHKEKHARYLKAGDRLCCCDHRMVKFRTVRGNTKVNTMIKTVSFRLWTDQSESERIPWKMIQERGLRQFVDSQGLLLLRQRLVHPYGKEIKQWQ